MVSANGITYFTIHVVRESGGDAFRVTKRYSDFHCLAVKLSFLRNFPRKHLRVCTGDKLEKRRKQLELWLKTALQHQHFLRRSLLREFLLPSVATAPFVDPVPSPVAGTPLRSLQVPDLRQDPEGWFRHFDANGNGLEQHEVIKALLATFPGSDPYSARDFITGLWAEFDLDGSGTISLSEFLQHRGLRESILAQMQLQPNGLPSPAVPQQDSAEDAPSLVTLEVEIPPGVQAGQSLQITVPDGRQALITVPEGYGAGMSLQFDFDSQDGTLTLL